MGAMPRIMASTGAKFVQKYEPKLLKKLAIVGNLSPKRA